MLGRLPWITLLVPLLACGSTEGASTSTPTDEPPAEPAPGGPEVEEPPVDEHSAEAEEAAPPAPPDTAPHEVVIVVVHDDPLLRSESRLLEVIAERMQMRRIDAVQREATADEASYARAFFAGQGDASAALPASLTAAGAVVFFRVPPNRELGDGRLATRGFGGVIAFRRGERTPYFELRVDDAAAWRGADEQLWPWLISLVRAEQAS